MMRRKAWLPIVLSLGLLAAACGDDSDSDSDASTDDGDNGGATEEAANGVNFEECEGELSASGASFPDAAYQEIITAFGEVAPNMVVDYNAVGSSTGKEEFGQNLNDFAGTDSLVDEGDGPEEGTYLYVPTVAASVTASYNLPDVEELNLTADVLAQIFQREITTWDDEAIAEANPDVELPSTDITVARRSDGSGTTANFTAYLDDASDLWELGSDDTVEWPSDTQGGPQNTGVAQIVSDNEGAIGYVDLGDAQELELQTALIENSEGSFVAPSVEGTQAALASSELAEDLTYDPLNGPGADAYPITAPTFILVRTDYDETKAEQVKCFLTYLLTDGGDVVTEVGFAPLPDELGQQALDQLENI
jgi:phosphate transport system substrate-binding protein